MLGWPHLPAWLVPTNQTFRILKLPRSGFQWRERNKAYEFIFIYFIKKIRHGQNKAKRCLDGLN
jgi:hypothetical protein